ncbi:MAG: hypothetical protein JO323_09510 [Acidobacteriia bacterium]|nr:hypothetical protein [Terriglobia bacterium]
MTNGSLATLALRFNPTGGFTTAPVYPQNGAPIIGGTGRGDGGLISFSTLSAVLTFQPVGYSSGQLPLTITPNADHLTYTATSGIGITFTNGTVSGETLTFNSMQAGVDGLTQFIWGANDLQVSSASLSLMLQPTSTAGIGLGTITGTLTIAGKPLPTGGASITPSGAITGNCTALP